MCTMWLRWMRCPLFGLRLCLSCVSSFQSLLSTSTCPLDLVVGQPWALGDASISHINRSRRFDRFAKNSPNSAHERGWLGSIHPSWSTFAFFAHHDAPVFPYNYDSTVDAWFSKMKVLSRTVLPVDARALAWHYSPCHFERLMRPARTTKV